jgi:hypothetical protein
MVEDHHGELAPLRLDQIAFCDERITQLSARISAQPASIRQARGIDTDGTTGPTAGRGSDAMIPPASMRSPASAPR